MYYDPWSPNNQNVWPHAGDDHFSSYQNGYHLPSYIAGRMSVLLSRGYFVYHDTSHQNDSGSLVNTPKYDAGDEKGYSEETRDDADAIKPDPVKKPNADDADGDDDANGLTKSSKSFKRDEDDNQYRRRYKPKKKKYIRPKVIIVKKLLPFSTTTIPGFFG